MGRLIPATRAVTSLTRSGARYGPGWDRRGGRPRCRRRSRRKVAPVVDVEREVEFRVVRMAEHNDPRMGRRGEGILTAAWGADVPGDRHHDERHRVGARHMAED